MTTIERERPPVWKENGYTVPDCFIKVRTGRGEVLVAWHVPRQPRIEVEFKTVSTPAINGFKFPEIRRVHPVLLTQEIVSVQPMTMPSGLIFAIEYTGEKDGN